MNAGQLQQIHDYILTIDRRVEPGALSVRLGMTVNDLVLFRERYRITIGRLIYVTVLRHSRWLLLTTKLGIKQIADQVGYSSIYSFSEAYKNYFGHSPKNERKKPI